MSIDHGVTKLYQDKCNRCRLPRLPATDPERQLSEAEQVLAQANVICCCRQSRKWPENRP